MAASKQCKHKNRHTNSLKCDASSISAGIFSPTCPQVAGETSAGHAIMYRCFDVQLPFCALHVEAKPMTIFFLFLKRESALTFEEWNVAELHEQVANYWWTWYWQFQWQWFWSILAWLSSSLELFWSGSLGFENTGVGEVRPQRHWKAGLSISPPSLDCQQCHRYWCVCDLCFYRDIFIAPSFKQNAF